MSVFIYPNKCKDFTTTGLVGDIHPIECVFTEEANGECQLTMKLTYDEFGRWKAAQKDNIIKCEVPVRVPPVIRNDEYANTVTKGTTHA